MYSLTQLLRNIGLSEKEAITYLVSLKIGTNPASIIAKHAELNRCTTYSILESLVKKGLVFQFEKDKIRYFTAIGPKQLLNYIDEKRSDLNFYKEEINNFMSEFESLRHPHQVVPIVKSYTGKSGIKKLYHELTKEPIISIWGTDARKHHEFFDRFIPNFITEPKTIRLLRKKDRNIEKIAISSSNDISKIKPCTPLEFIGIKRVIIISPKEPYGIEILHPDIVQHLQEKFNYIWNS